VSCHTDSFYALAANNGSPSADAVTVVRFTARKNARQLDGRNPFDLPPAAIREVNVELRNTLRDNAAIENVDVPR
jgi:hypothetical protein